MKVVFRGRAVNDLRAIFKHIRKDNPKSAIETVAHILHAVELLKDFPLLGRTGIVPKTRELVVAGTAYICVYRTARGTIEIIAVLHGAQKRDA
jgi:toxin ParE1/3/4